MDVILRLFLRFILVPLGYLAAVLAGLFVIIFASWPLDDRFIGEPAAMFGIWVGGPVLLVMLLGMMWLPGSVGILISEVLAIRSWIFHALNGGVSAWVGWQMLTAYEAGAPPLSDPKNVIAAGLAGGFAYWAVAGWNAGFWKPVFRRAELPPPAGDPFNPPAQTKA